LEKRGRWTRGALLSLYSLCGLSKLLRSVLFAEEVNERGSVDPMWARRRGMASNTSY